MNQQNIDALEQALREAGGSDIAARRLAETLAARGVLVPDILTDDQCTFIMGDPGDPDDPVDIRARLRGYAAKKPRRGPVWVTG